MSLPGEPQGSILGGRSSFMAAILHGDGEKEETETGCNVRLADNH